MEDGISAVRNGLCLLAAQSIIFRDQRNLKLEKSKGEMMSEPHNHLSPMVDSVYLQVSLLQHPSNQPLQRTEWSPPDAGKERGALGRRHCSQMLAQGLLGRLPRRQPQAQAGPGRDGVQPDYHCSSSKQRGFSPKHIASCHLSPQQLPDALSQEAPGQHPPRATPIHALVLMSFAACLGFPP